MPAPRLTSYFRALTAPPPDASQTLQSRRHNLQSRKRTAPTHATDDRLDVSRFTAPGKRTNPVVRKRLRDFVRASSALVGGEELLVGSDLSSVAKLLYDSFCSNPTFGAQDVQALFGYLPDHAQLLAAKQLASQLLEYDVQQGQTPTTEDDPASPTVPGLDLRTLNLTLTNLFRDSAPQRSSRKPPQQQPPASSTSATATATPPTATTVAITGSWLYARCEQHLALAQQTHLTVTELAKSVLAALQSPTSDDNLQGELFDLLGMSDGTFEFVGLLLQHRAEIHKISPSTIMSPADAASRAAPAGGAFAIESEADRALQRELKREQRRAFRAERRGPHRNEVGGSVHKRSDQLDSLAEAGFDQAYLEQERALGLQKNQSPSRKKGGWTNAKDGFPDDRAFSMGNKKALPAGTTRKWLIHEFITSVGAKDKGGNASSKKKDKNKDNKDAAAAAAAKKPTSKYEEVFVPAPIVDKKVLANEYRVPISAFSEVAQVAFRGIPTLNRLQSRLFEKAYMTNHNLLVCAPTGAGKTNVAMTTVVREIERHIHGGVLDTKSLKIIYVAPMKALAQEVVEKFGERLAPLGIKVRELTGDMQLTKREIEETHLIVTTPEKWDVITRKSGDGTLVEVVGLLIIDEVHLVGEDRGPVIEALVARTLRLVEQKQKMVRIVGLSATLPNFVDVAMFLRVDLAHGMFFFDNSFRPVPLEQTFVGVQEKSLFKRLALLNEVAYVKALDSVRRGHQVMIFVHSRNDTVKTARAIIQAATMDPKGMGTNAFTGHGRGNKAAVEASNRFQRDVAKSRNAELRELFDHGIGCHHAGMLRSDRSLTEKMFEQGALSVLCCTATLAWGVNLPAHTVIIKGTQIYQADKGGLVELNMQDVFQCFGRAGRPQYDTSGEAVLITEHEQLPRYLGMLNHAVPLESQLIKGLPDALNAEVVSGTVTNVAEACEWLSYTFLHIRMLRNPIAYGITAEELATDPLLQKKKVELVAMAARRLDDARMSRFGMSKVGFVGASTLRNVKPTAPLGVTDLGRVASHYYINHETIEVFNSMLKQYMSDSEILHAFSHASEFNQLKVRDEEIPELGKLANRCCPLEIQASVDSEKGKTVVLFQAYISRIRVESFTLSSDMNYISQNMGRIARAVFEICLKKGWSSMAERTLVICTAIEKRCWWPPYGHPLRQFVPRLPAEIVHKLEAKGSLGELDRIIELEPKEVGQLVNHVRMGDKILDCAWQIPHLQIQTVLQPITRSILRVSLSLVPDFVWRDSVHGNVQSFWLWVEDQNSEWVYHSERFTLLKRDWQSYQQGKKMHEDDQVGDHGGARQREGVSLPALNPATSKFTSSSEEAYYDFDAGAKREFTIPIFDPLPPQYYIRIVSDRWLGTEVVHPLSLHDLVLPEKHTPHTKLLDLTPLPRAALDDANFERLYKDRFEYFNPIQTQIFHVLYHTDQNCLLGAPTGSGKTVSSELALLRLFRCHPGAKAVYIAPLKALVSERIKDWRNTIGRVLNKRVEEMTGDVTPSASNLRRADVLITTPEKWDGVSRMWQQRKYVQQVQLIIIDEIHLLGEERGAVLEVIVSRMRYISERRDVPIRIVGLSTALANARDLGDWLGVDVQKDSAVGLFNFRPSVRPVPLEAHIHGFPGKHYCPRMATMNKPTYQAILNHSPTKPVLVFVASRRQTRLTALDLISFCAASDDPRRFLHIPFEDLDALIGEGGGQQQVQDDALRHTLAFGIGIHHAGLDPKDRELVEYLFCSGKIQVLVCTSTLAWGVNFPAHLVVIKGTEYYDAKTKRYKPFPITDVLQMMGRAGRPQFDDTGVAMILVEESLKNFYKKFLYEPFPVESHLPEFLHNHINAEIASGTITCKRDAVDYLSWTYFFRRLPTNPSYYGLNDNSPSSVVEFLMNMINRVVDDLIASKCVTTKERKRLADSSSRKAAGWNAPGKLNTAKMKNDTSLMPTVFGQIASFYYLDHSTLGMFEEGLSTRHARLCVELDGQPASPLRLDSPIAQLRNKTQHWMLELVANAAEYREVPVRHNEENLNEELSAALPWKSSSGSFESPHVKTFLMLQAHFKRVPAPIKDYVNDTKSVLDQAPRIINAIVDVCAGTLRDLYMVLEAMRLAQTIVQGRWFDEPTVSQVPCVSPTVAGNLSKHAKKDARWMGVSKDEVTVGQLLSMKPKAACQLLKKAGLLHRHETAARKALNRLPVVSVRCAIEKGDKGLVAKVSMSSRGWENPNAAGPVVAPFGRYSKKKDIAFWVVIGTGEKTVAAMRRVGTVGDKRGRVVELPLDSGERPSQEYWCYLVCDSVMGLDQVVVCDVVA